MLAQTDNYRLALPDHKGRLGWSIDGFKDSRELSQTGWREIGVRGSDTAGRVTFLGFLFLVPDGAPLTSAKCRDGDSVGSKNKSEGINAAGNTEEIYATSTSGMGPTGPASTRTGRNFIPAVSPNGKLARQISPGRIYGLAIRQSVKVLPHVAQLVTPSLRHVPGPKGARLVFIRPHDNQLNTPGRQVPRCFSVDVVIFVDFAHYADGSHTVDPPSFSHQFATSGTAWPADLGVLWFSLKRQCKNSRVTFIDGEYLITYSAYSLCSWK